MTPEKELEQLVKSHLKVCDTENYPKLCEMTSTEEGLEAASNMVYEFCIHNGVSVQTALALIESEI